MTLAEMLRVPGWQPEKYESADAQFRLTIKFLDKQRSEAADRIEKLEAALRSIYMRLPQEDDDDYTDLHSKICDIIGSVIDVET